MSLHSLVRVKACEGQGINGVLANVQLMVGLLGL